MNTTKITFSNKKKAAMFLVLLVQFVSKEQIDFDKVSGSITFPENDVTRALFLGFIAGRKLGYTLW